MITLAIDFSTERRAVCVTDHAARTGTAMVEDRQAGALALVEAALVEAGVDRSEIEVIGVGLGPGSYTGIRSAIGIAQGWQLAQGLKLVGISSMDLMARSVPGDGEFTVLVDAQRGEFYGARYLRKGDAVSPVSPVAIVSPAEIEAVKRRYSPEPAKLPAGGESVFPDPLELARMATTAEAIAAEDLAPIYLRAVEFKKSPPARTVI